MRHETERRRTTLHAQVLILIFGAMLFGGSGLEHLPERVQDVVEDEDRAERAADTARRLDERTDEALQSIVSLRSELYSTIARHSSPSAELRPVLDRAVSTLGAAQADLLDLRFELHDAMTEGEWDDLMARLIEDETRMVARW